METIYFVGGWGLMSANTCNCILLHCLVYVVSLQRQTIHYFVTIRKFLYKSNHCNPQETKH